MNSRSSQDFLKPTHKQRKTLVAITGDGSYYDEELTMAEAGRLIRLLPKRKIKYCKERR
jgi:hypothetical protein